MIKLDYRDLLFLVFVIVAVACVNALVRYMVRRSPKSDSEGQSHPAPVGGENTKAISASVIASNIAITFVISVGASIAAQLLSLLWEALQVPLTETKLNRTDITWIAGITMGLIVYFYLLWISKMRYAMIAIGMSVYIGLSIIWTFDPERTLEEFFCEVVPLKVCSVEHVLGPSLITAENMEVPSAGRNPNGDRRGPEEGAQDEGPPPGKPDSLAAATPVEPEAAAASVEPDIDTPLTATLEFSDANAEAALVKLAVVCPSATETEPYSSETIMEAYRQCMAPSSDVVSQEQFTEAVDAVLSRNDWLVEEPDWRASKFEDWYSDDCRAWTNAIVVNGRYASGQKPSIEVYGKKGADGVTRLQLQMPEAGPFLDTSTVFFILDEEQIAFSKVAGQKYFVPYGDIGLAIRKVLYIFEEEKEGVSLVKNNAFGVPSVVMGFSAQGFTLAMRDVIKSCPDVDTTILERWGALAYEDYYIDPGNVFGFSKSALTRDAAIEEAIEDCEKDSEWRDWLGCTVEDRESEGRQVVVKNECLALSSNNSGIWDYGRGATGTDAAREAQQGCIEANKSITERCERVAVFCASGILRPANGE